MSLLLAPYNDAMRLGMGFNSFTQQLCINDAVRLADGKKGEPATDQHLRPQYRHGQMVGADGGNVDVSQDVVWTAKFVDRISEVTDSLNVSGSLQIKCDAIGGGGKASASFFDTNKFKESDINYLIQVRVTNQRLSAPDLIHFDPVAHVPNSEFTRVYGDSFISGFTEGGEFNALISIKLKDRSSAKAIKGQLEVDMNFKAASVSGSAAVDKSNSSSNIDGETTISVSWKGGGDIKDAEVSDWTLASLKAVAMEFPEHVMACPMRTNAILTKYTALKSFYETSVRGTPLQYENAGVYSSALLDAYMDYKVMWRDIQQAGWEVKQGQSMLTAKADIPQFADLALEAKADYTTRLKQHQRRIEEIQARNATKALPTPAVSTEEGTTESASADPTQPAASDALSSAPAATTRAVVKSSTTSPAPVAFVSIPEELPEAPMPPNNLKPYKPDIFGLDAARRDCRFEMIKIVREVDAVANDPKVACDPTRLYQYLSPAVFQMLLPTVTNLSKQKAAELAAEEAKKVEEDQAKEKDKLKNDLVSSQRDLGKLQDKQRELERTKGELEGKVRDLEAAKSKLNPHNGWAPFALNTPIRFRSIANRTSLDFDWSDNRGSKNFGQYDAVEHNNQKFEILSIGPKAFAIRHIASGRYITTQNSRPDGGVYMGMGDFPFPVTFQCLLDERGNANGKVMIRFAEQDEYTFNSEGIQCRKLIGWMHAKGANDEWQVKAFNDLSM
ncbi:hypothetical protein MVEN_02556500 [Mycena venus]|uniref:H-type lectin domain-containing protein n=1 Tax=Mycena venus TaxID=2733690 RepID=A0A8H6TZL7_9AGAR|nr:hypothetical protein MVEN_02556500 [Mycena venus]